MTSDQMKKVLQARSLLWDVQIELFGELEKKQKTVAETVLAGHPDENLKMIMTLVVDVIEATEIRNATAAISRVAGIYGR